MTGRDGTLQGVGSEWTVKALGTRKCRESSADEQLIPQSPILLQQENRLSRWAYPCRRPGGLQLHQRDQAVDLGRRRVDLGQNPAQAQRVLAQRWTHPIPSGGRRVAFIEDEIDYFQYRRQPRCAFRGPRNFKGHAGFAQCPLGAYDALLDR